MVVVRLKRMGRKKRPFYRIVVVDSRFKRDGRVIEEIGYYNPLISPHEKLTKEYYIDGGRYRNWVSYGAQPSLAVQVIAKKVLV